MTTYTLALFVHIVGAIGTFIGVSVWLFAAMALRRAQSVGQVRTLTSLIQPSGVVTIVSILLLGVAGFYMAITVWGERATWIIVATISFLLLAPFGAVVIDRRLRALAKAAATALDGPLPESLAARAQDPLVGNWAVRLHCRAARHRLPDDDQADTPRFHHRDCHSDGARAGVRTAALVGDTRPLTRCGDGSRTRLSPPERRER